MHFRPLSMFQSTFSRQSFDPANTLSQLAESVYQSIVDVVAALPHIWQVHRRPSLKTAGQASLVRLLFELAKSRNDDHQYTAMEVMEMHMGTPWLDKPIALHDEGGRAYECSLNDTALCDWQSGYWRFWYEADHHYALPTIAFFLATIVLFGAGHLFNLLASLSIRQSKGVRPSTALLRFVSYRAFRISALNWTTAPLGIMALGAVGTIYFFCMTLAPKPYYWPVSETLHWGNSPPIATRAGWLSLACLPFIFATAGKSNFITAVTGVSHEKLQVFHRWISYACFITALIHTFPFIIYNISKGTMVENWNTSVFYWTGVVALIAQGYLTFASLSPLRSMGYEWFKFSHFVAALVFVLFLFFHCDHTLSSWDYFIATGVLFSLSWLHRQVRIYFEHGIGHRANVSLVANGFICVRIPTTATWGVGQHFFVRFLSLGIHTVSIHPFTACSLPAENSSYDTTTSELVLYIRPQGGFTARLAKHAESHPNSTIRVLLDGPYGGIHGQTLSSSTRQLVVAGGSGAGWLLPMISTFLHDHQHGTVATAEPSRSAKVVLATRDAATHGWFEETVLELLSTFGLEKVPANLEIELYYTGAGHEQPDTKADTASNKLVEAQANEKQPVARAGSDSSSEVARAKSLKRFNGRPDLQSMVHAESTSPTLNGQLGVFVCGPASMQIDTSNAVAAEQLAVLRGGRNDVYLHMEHFSWA